MLNLFEVVCLHRSEPGSCVGLKACAMFLALWTPSSDPRGAPSLRRATTRWHCESTRGRWSLYIPSSWSSQRHFFVRPQPRETPCRLSSLIIHAGKRFIRVYFFMNVVVKLDRHKNRFLVCLAWRLDPRNTRAQTAFWLKAAWRRGLTPGDLGAVGAWLRNLHQWDCVEGRVTSYQVNKESKHLSTSSLITLGPHILLSNGLANALMKTDIWTRLKNRLSLRNSLRRSYFAVLFL